MSFRRCLVLGAALLFASSVLLGCPRIETRTPPVATLAQAPDFSLPDESGKPVSLTELRRRGPVLLVFYRGHWCPYCRDQLRELARANDRFLAKGAQIVGISADAPEDSRELARKLDVKFPLLSDPQLKVISAYGVAMQGEDIAVPSVFLVRDDGRVVWQKVGDTMADRPTAEGLLEILDQTRVAASDAARVREPK